MAVSRDGIEWEKRGAVMLRDPNRDYETVAACGAILRTSEDGRFTIGTNWERVCEVFHNEDDHHCIHSLGAIPLLEPGETRTVCGKIVLVEGTPEQALKMLGFQPRPRKRPGAA